MIKTRHIMMVSFAFVFVVIFLGQSTLAKSLNSTYLGSRAQRAVDESNSIIFSDDFSGDLSQWSDSIGTWTINENDELTGTGLGGQIDAWIYAGETSWTDYSLQAKVIFVDYNSELVVRSTGHWLNEYRISFWEYRPGYFYSNMYQIVKYQDGIATNFTNGNVPSPVLITNPSIARVEVIGDEIALYLNGQFVDRLTDPEPLLSGRIGLGVIWSYTNRYDDVIVQPVSSSRLSLPFPHDGPATGLKNIFSYFDHAYPIYSSEPVAANTSIVKFTGEELPGTLADCDGGDSCYSGHNGIDFTYGLTDSTPVLAAAGGTVTSGTSTCEGNWVKIHHGDYLTYYAHLQNDAYWLRSGTVVAGDRIGTVGNSGTCSKGAHLHFQVYYDQNHDGYFSYPNEVVDPYGWRDQCSTIGSDPWTVTFTDRYNISHTGATSTWLWDFGQPTCARVSGLSSHSFASEDGVTISIPAGAVIQDVTLGYNLAPEPESADMTVNNPLTSAETIPVGHTFQLSGVYVDTTWLSTFAIPVSLTVIYEDEELLYGDEGSLMLYAWQPGTASWMPLVTTLNTENNSAQAWTDRAGIFSLRAQPLQAAPVVSGVTPVEVSNVGMVNITIEGVNFSPTPTVNLWVGGLEVSFVSSSELTAVIPAGLAPGSYDLIVRNPDGQTVVVPDAITIKGIFFLPLMLR